jgi:hypothetical protein
MRYRESCLSEQFPSGMVQKHRPSRAPNSAQTEPSALPGVFVVLRRFTSAQLLKCQRLQYKSQSERYIASGMTS